MKKPFNVKKFYRRTFLVIYDIISVILASYLALMIRYGFSAVSYTHLTLPTNSRV